MLVVIGRWFSKRSCDTCSADNRLKGQAVPQERISFDFPKVLARRLLRSEGGDHMWTAGRKNMPSVSHGDYI